MDDWSVRSMTAVSTLGEEIHSEVEKEGETRKNG